MIPIALLLLFVIQVVVFYFLALLYMKVTKFNDLEKKQRQLMAEMDNSIAAYLSELKDENARLIATLESRDEKVERKPVQSTASEPSENTTVSPNNKSRPIDISSPAVPIGIALKSYQAVSATTLEEPSEAIVQMPKDARTLAFEMHDAGRSIEEIAKLLGKGRTEVELILKFR